MIFDSKDGSRGHRRSPAVKGESSVCAGCVIILLCMFTQLRVIKSLTPMNPLRQPKGLAPPQYIQDSITKLANSEAKHPVLLHRQSLPVSTIQLQPKTGRRQQRAKSGDCVDLFSPQVAFITFKVLQPLKKQGCIRAEASQ